MFFNKTVKNLNLKIPGGKTTLVTGASGVGKTTLVNLIYRFLDPHNGEILIDGQNTKDLKFSFRNKISICPQNHYFFSDTILNNIRCANFHKYYKEIMKQQVIETKEMVQEYIPINTEVEPEIIELTKQFGIYDKIMEFPGQFNYNIGDNGAKLSGGERQRINLIRTFLKESEIFIFDEPTNFLDTMNQVRFLDKCKELTKQHKTVIIISHELALADNVGNVLCFKEDGTFEFGPHEELLKREGRYSDLWSASLI